ncbi:thylakoid membrane phosphoprotein 14 kDa protein [Medicago truncatula]|uniref:Thylakoid membrane phosphoprotein 14 kDa protein n=1 Tax=Medicago truncatula TaxID=3880 RepID=A0A072U6B7_MEDTR|nr:thylakoid membrane phosphoprotein 14 kDa protein [Medicago truncatula]
MASSASSSTFSSFTLVDGKPPCRHSAASPQCVSLPPLQSHTRPWKTTAFCRKIARNVISMASSTTTETEADAATTEVASTDPSTVTDSPELVKTIQQTWDKVEDKYAVSALAVAGTVALWGSAGVISVSLLPFLHIYYINYDSLTASASASASDETGN